MRFSLDWLRDHVAIDLPPAELSRRLTAAGLAVEGIEPFGDDAILEVDVTGNRPDCMNHRGLAREIAAFTGRSLLPLDASLPCSPSLATSSVASVRIDAPDLCSRYTARVVLGVRIAPSPGWLERRLRAIGLVPKFNVVDAANYVLWDLGHPLHTFDLDRLEGRTIVVRRAGPGERLVTVADGLEHPLMESMLVIADASRPVAIAGVMGGLDSGISETSRNVLVESAWFDPVSVRRTARALGMHTDASHRFERGADPGITLLAADRLCRMILELAGGECPSGAIDAPAGARPVQQVRLRRKRLVEVLGAEVPEEDVESRLGGLEIALQRSPEGWSATIPTHRPDLQIEEDLIEEVGRSIGYDRFPSTLPSTTTLPVERLRHEETDARLREALARLGYSEMIGYAMVGRKEDALFAPPGAAAPVAVENPLSERWEVMRRSILPGLVHAAGHNIRHGQRDLALFEIGTIFVRSELPAGPAGSPTIREERVVGLLGCGRAGAQRWNLPNRPFDVYDLTGAIEGVALVFGVAATSVEPVSGTEADPFLHPQQCFRVVLGRERIGFGGALHPDLAVHLELPRGCLIAQLLLGPLEAHRAALPSFRPLPRFPAVSRDISAIVSSETLYAELERVLREALAGAPAHFVLTDRYAGPPLPAGKVSFTFNIGIEPEDRTWTAEEIDDLTGRVMNALIERVGAEIRR